MQNRNRRFVPSFTKNGKQVLVQVHVLVLVLVPVCEMPVEVYMLVEVYYFIVQYGNLNECTQNTN